MVEGVYARPSVLVRAPCIVLYPYDESDVAKDWPLHGSSRTGQGPEETMRSQPIVTCLAGVLLLAGTTAGIARAENWPAWRGPTGDGVSTETNLPVEWDTERNIAWKLPMPAWSGSTPIVWGDLIFLNVAVDDDNIELWCLDRDTGRSLWTRRLSDGNRRLRKQNMSSPSPVTDGEHVWVMTGTGILKAFDVGGNELWMRDIPASYGRFGLNWGYASSPLLHDGALFVQVLHGMRTDDPSYVLRIDALTGETLWRVERPSLAVRESPDSYTTPALLEYDGTTEIVITGGDAVTGHDPETGRELWRADGLNPTRQRDYRIVASPFVRDGVIYAPTRVRPLLALRPGGRGDVLDSHVIWSTDNGPDVPTPVTDGEYFYVVNDRGIVFVTDAKSGEPVYGPQRIRRGTYSASPVLADGRIYVTNESGMTTVLRAGPEFEVLAENDFDDYCLSSPAVSEGQLFIRTTGYLYAIGERRAPATTEQIAAGVAAAAEELLAALDEPQRALVRHDLDAAVRRNWSNLPVGVLDFTRPGVRMGDLSDAQRDAVFDFLRGALSEEGFAKVTQIVRADEMLAQTSPRAERFGWTEDNFWFAVFGAPSATDTWAWQFGGHHLGVNVTIEGDRMFLTPTFMGVEPAAYEDGGEAFAPLHGELDGGVALVSALDAAQQAAAVVDDRPREVYAGAGQDGVAPPVEGARAGEWTAVQREMLLALAARWIGMLPEPAAEARLQEVAADLDETRFAWNGPTDGSDSIYYRIQGPRLLIEFSTQGNVGGTAGHFHSIYRNPVNEYGGAPLAPEQQAVSGLTIAAGAAAVLAVLVLGRWRWAARRR